MICSASWPLRIMSRSSSGCLCQIGVRMRPDIARLTRTGGNVSLFSDYALIGVLVIVTT